MSKHTRELLEALKLGDRTESLLGTVTEGVQAVAPGLSLSKIFSDIGSELSQLGDHGRTEMAAALFNGNAFVTYMQGKESPDQAPEQGLAAELTPQVELGCDPSSAKGEKYVVFEQGP